MEFAERLAALIARPRDRKTSLAAPKGARAIDPVTFESRSAPNIHVIGDACLAGAMPKSAFSANAQAKACASAVATLISGGSPAAPK